MIRPIDYLEHRIAELKRTHPQTVAGRRELEHTIHELHNIVMALRLQAVNELQHAQKEAGIH